MTQPTIEPNPLTIFGADLDTWLRADVGITKTGVDVDEWADVLSGNGRTFSQVDPGRPTFRASDPGFHGLPVIDFDQSGTSQRFVSDDPASDWTFLHDGSPSFVWAVWKPDGSFDGGPTASILGTVNTGSNVGARYLWSYDADEPRLIINNGSGSPAVTFNGTGTQADVVQTNGFAYEEGRGGNEAEIWVNDVSNATDDSVLAPSGADPFATLRIGANGNDAGPIAGQIHEIIIVAAYPTAAQITLLNEYSRGRYY